MIVRLITLCAIIVFSACSVDLPREVEVAASSDDRSKNSFARKLVQDIRRIYGSDAILTMGSESPRGNDFSPQVREFAARAAVAYTNRAPDFLVFYEFEEVDGYLTGPGIVNFVLTASLVRPVSVNEGAEIIYLSKYSGRCRRGGSGFESSCSELQPVLAEAALYSLRRP